MEDPKVRHQVTIIEPFKFTTVLNHLVLADAHIVLLLLPICNLVSVGFQINESPGSNASFYICLKYLAPKFLNLEEITLSIAKQELWEKTECLFNLRKCYPFYMFSLLIRKTQTSFSLCLPFSNIYEGNNGNKKWLFSRFPIQILKNKKQRENNVVFL